MKPLFLSGKILLETCAKLERRAPTRPEMAEFRNTPRRCSALRKPGRYVLRRSLLVLAMAMVTGVSAVGQNQTETAPPPIIANTLPANVVPGSPLAEVVKLIQAGMDVP